MAASAILRFSSSLPHLPLYPQPHRKPLKAIPIKATSQSTTLPQPLSITTKTNSWPWKFNSTPIKIHFEQLENQPKQETNKGSFSSFKNVLLVPTISDVSTVEEWRKVAELIVGRREDGEVGYKATIVDWPGLGYSDRPKLEYNADVMEMFLVDFVNSPDSPISSSGE